MKVDKKIVTKILLGLGTFMVLGLLSYAVFFKTDKNEYSSSSVEINNGVQYIDIKAGLGYSPNRILASANLPTKLNIETKNTYDCTAFLNIPQLDVKKFLPPTGFTEIAIDEQNPGTEIEGFCGSDTYKFIIKFS